MDNNNAVKLDANSSLEIRDKYVNTAVSFLQNKAVINTPLASKQDFLRRKGLTDEEIRVACEKAGAYVQEQQSAAHIIKPIPPPSLQPYYGGYHGQLVQLSWFDRVREVVHSFAIFSAVIYAVYKFYQKFIAPYLFGKKKSIEESLQDLDKNVKSSVEELKDSLTSVRVEVDRINQNGESSTLEQLHELKSDIATVKGLLLSRKQFPAVSSNSPVVPPSIPAWQMSSVPPESDEHDRKSEDMELCSGSGSSEPEHCTHKSDSSLEIIYSKESDNESYHRLKSCDEMEKD